MRKCTTGSANTMTANKENQVSFDLQELSCSRSVFLESCVIPTPGRAGSLSHVDYFRDQLRQLGDISVSEHEFGSLDWDLIREE